MKILKKFFRTIKGIFHKKASKRSASKRSKKLRRKPVVKRKRIKRTGFKKKSFFKSKRKVKKTKPVKKAAAPVKKQEPKVPPEVLIGDITHFFSRISVCVIKMRGPLKVGERIHIKGNSSDFVQTVQSLQIESVDVKSVRRGQLVGLKTTRAARPGDKVYKPK